MTEFEAQITATKNDNVRQRQIIHEKLSANFCVFLAVRLSKIHQSIRGTKFGHTRTPGWSYSL